MDAKDNKTFEKPDPLKLDQNKRLILPKNRPLTWEEWEYLGWCSGRHSEGQFTFKEYIALPHEKRIWKGDTLELLLNKRPCRVSGGWNTYDPEPVM